MSKEAEMKNVTPVGELNYVTITGDGKRNYNDDGDIFTATIILEGDEAEAERAKYDEIIGDIPKGMKLGSSGYKQIFVDDEGNERTKNQDGEIIVDDEDVTDDFEATDRWSFTYSTNTEFTNKKDEVVQTTIDTYNRHGKKVDMGDKLVGNGSLGCLSGKIKRYTNTKGKKVGASAFLKAVQITKFVEYEGGAGFGEQDGEFDGAEDEDTGFTGVDEDTATGKKESSKKKPKKKPKL